MKKHFLGATLAFLAIEDSLLSRANKPLNYATAADLEREANSNLSNFSGGGGAMSGYTGMGDEFLNFSGNYGSFADPIDQGKLYSIILTNANSATRTALLCPGLLYETAAGLIVDGAFNDTQGGAGLSATGTPQAIAYFNSYIRYFPTIVAAFKVSSSNVTQFEMSITIQKQSPFKQYDTRIINIAAEANEQNPNTNLISVDQSFYMDNQTLISYPVLGSTTVSLGLFFGVSLNIAHALYQKTEKAASTLAVSPNKMTSSFRGRLR